MFEVPIRFRFFDKLKLYNDFISKKSIYQNKLWKECQVVLAWAASSRHQHIGIYLDANDIVKIFFGVSATLYNIKKELQGEKLKKRVREKFQLKECFNSEFIESIANDLINSNGDDIKIKIEQIIKNLHAMGFGDLGNEDKIRINQKGFLMGELIREINESTWGKKKYFITIWIMRLFIILLFLYSFTFMIVYLYHKWHIVYLVKFLKFKSCN